MLGPVLLCGGLGHPLALTVDRATELPPINGFIAQRMLERTRIAHWISQQDDLAPHLVTWERLLAQVGEIVTAIPEIHALDIQPLQLSKNGLTIGHVRVRLQSLPKTKQYSDTAIAPYPRHLYRPITLKNRRIKDQEQSSSLPQLNGLTKAELRPIHPGDAQALQHFVRELSPQTRYMRFISSLTELTPRMLVRYTQIDYDREMALIIAIPEGENNPNKIIGVVRYLLNDDRTSCEYAIAIADAWQHQGLGNELMHAIIECARSKQLKMIEGFILATNTPMLNLLGKLGFKVERDPDDSQIRRVRLMLGANSNIQS